MIPRKLLLMTGVGPPLWATKRLENLGIAGQPGGMRSAKSGHFTLRPEAYQLGAARRRLTTYCGEDTQDFRSL